MLVIRAAVLPIRSTHLTAVTQELSTYNKLHIKMHCPICNIPRHTNQQEEIPSLDQSSMRPTQDDAQCMEVGKEIRIAWNNRLQKTKNNTNRNMSCNHKQLMLMMLS